MTTLQRELSGEPVPELDRGSSCLPRPRGSSADDRRLLPNHAERLRRVTAERRDEDLARRPGDRRWWGRSPSGRKVDPSALFAPITWSHPQGVPSQVLAS